MMELMVVLAIISVLATVVVANFVKQRTNAQTHVCNQQAQALQNHLNAWVARQPSLAVATAQFQAGQNGDYVPKDLKALLQSVSETLQQDTDAFSTEDNTTVVSEALKARDAHITITWPLVLGSLRNSYPRANLILPAE